MTLAQNNFDVPDKIRRGLGLAARAAGAWCALYRPQSASAPMGSSNLLLNLPAMFANPKNFRAPVGYGDAMWEGYFDAGYSRAGDYVCGPDGVFFIASQPRLGPVLCVKTNRMLSFARPAAPTTAGVNRYVSVQQATAASLLTDWPASVLAAGVGGRGALPADAPGVIGGAGGWSVLLPAVRVSGATIMLHTGDLATDDLGRTGIVSTTELTDLGWRLHIRQATS